CQKRDSMNSDLFSSSAYSVGGIVLVATIYVTPFILIFRRTGRSGWWGLLMLVPLANFIIPWALALIRWPSTVTDLQTEMPPRARLQDGSSMAGQVVELARREGAAFRSVRLSLETDGVIKMDTQDIGPYGTGISGENDDNEYEFWVRVGSAAIPQLAFELLHEKFASQLGAVTAFRDWCKTHSVEHEFGNWI
ncbi:MAG: hypothetical protein ACREFC_13620, partial [Stellaceae bacterium]